MTKSQFRVLAPRISRRQLLRGMILGSGLLFSNALQGCTAERRMAPATSTDGQLENKLNIYSWGDYDDPEVLADFGQRFGVKVHVDSYGSNEELIAKLAASRGTSGYDIVVPSSYMLPQMVEHDLLQPLNHDLLPNLNLIAPRFRHLSVDKNNDYSICKCFGTTGFIYDSLSIQGSPTSWQDFVDLAQGEASGKVALLEDAWEVCAIALAAKNQDLNTTDPGVLKQCRDLVVDGLAPHVKAYIGNAATAMSQGGFVLMHAFNGDARQGILNAKDPDRWKFVFPTPTANLWYDVWCIARGAPHPDAAHAFLNDILTPDNVLSEVDYIGYSTGAAILHNHPSQDQPETADFELPELIFPDEQILNRLVECVHDETMSTRVDIFSAAQTRSGT
ncbi:extracellular solute-binding protein [Corynebacterium sp. 3HC-13]|uniref:polyamine ABC transporter substrate-binding protein n=1 Tax=Corynebacterium poyangense TaxID=2684405 RepID=UPI001CCC5D72|nr:spermidine/putrescine ABC transporter substrate-binding protein [Corynebacterium poyangense]MBZ8177391.1 extracellular solute-binding protein [Corynebacterium poyangense]